MELVRPSEKYKESYLEALREYQADDSRSQRLNRYRELSLPDVRNDFASFILKKEKMARGEDLPPGYVPQSEYWLVERDVFMGAVNIRHVLNEELLNTGGHIGYDIRPSMRKRGYGKIILELALPKAREIGLDKVLVTCDETNEGSRKIIEANGGVLEDKRLNPAGGPDKLRYWINIG